MRAMRLHSIACTLVALAAAALLAACNRTAESPPPPLASAPAAPINVPAVPTQATDAWLGKWVGVEGLALEVSRGAEPGLYRLQVTLLDGTHSYEGRAEGNVIRFTRNGQPETLRAVTGDETGLKYLAGKKNCLMIKTAEGFCRD